MKRGGVSVLGTADYLADFWGRYRDASGIFWKLERRQEFKESDVPSWATAAAGDWPRALALIGQMRAEVAEEFAAVHKLDRRRIRIAESPVSPYLQWEMHVLRMRAGEGEEIRVVDAAAVRDWERDCLLPELAVFQDSAVYQLLYTAEGALEGARRSTDPGLIVQAESQVSALFESGEDLESFFGREIAPLSAPAWGSEQR